MVPMLILLFTATGLSVQPCLKNLARPQYFNSPRVLSVFLVDADPDDGRDDGLASQDGSSLFGIHRVLHPELLVDLDAVGRERRDRAIDDLRHHLLVAVGLFQLGRGHPDLSVGRNVFASLVQHLPGVLVGLQLGQSQPQLRRRGAALDRSREHDSSVFGLFQLDSELPEPDRVWDLLQSFPEDPLFGLRLGFQICGFDPKPKRNFSSSL